MKKFFISTPFFITILFSGLFPVISFAQTNTSLAVNCVATSSVAVNGISPCDFSTLIDSGTHLIDWMFYISVPIMVALMAYAGILYMTGLEKNISKAKIMFLKVAGGFTIMLIAFVAINTLVGWIGNPGFTTTASGASSSPAVFLQQ